MKLILQRLQRWAHLLKRDVHAVYLASRDPRVPWYAKALAAFIAAYALSPIDLIPDFVPILGYLDDLVIVPLGIWLVIYLVPTEVMAELRAAAESSTLSASSRIAAAFIILIWLLTLAWLAHWCFEVLNGPPPL